MAAPQQFFAGKTGKLAIEGYPCLPVFNWKYVIEYQPVEISNTNSLYYYNQSDSYSLQQFIPNIETSTITFDGHVDKDFAEFGIEPGEYATMTLMFDELIGFSDIDVLIANFDVTDDVTGNPRFTGSAIVTALLPTELPNPP